MVTGSAKTVHFDAGLARDRLTEYRRSNGLSPVSLDSRLTSLARQQADVMAARDTLSHDVGGSFSSRIVSAGIDNGRSAENVSYGVYSEEAALAQWRASPAHDRNLRMPGATRFGIAYARSRGAKPRVYWAMAIATDPSTPVATLATTGPVSAGPASIMAGPSAGGRVERRRVQEPGASIASAITAPFTSLFGN